MESRWFAIIDYVPPHPPLRGTFSHREKEKLKT